MSHTVVAELVAAVMKVEVEVGSKVAADDPVVILESMKMEIPVLAEVDGTVTEIVVSDGDVVNDGDPLVVIKVSGAESAGRPPDLTRWPQAHKMGACPQRRRSAVS